MTDEQLHYLIDLLNFHSLLYWIMCACLALLVLIQGIRLIIVVRRSVKGRMDRV